MRAGSISNGEILLRLALVMVLCGAIGAERQARDQVAGLRTHIIVGLGAGLFTLVSAYGFSGGGSRADPTRVAAQVVSGIGFLGAGAILRHGVTVRGVTTAGALWISAAIGMAGAAGFYFGAVATTVIALVALVALRQLRPLLRRHLGTERLSLEVELVAEGSTRGVLAELNRRGLHVEGLETRVLEDRSERLQLDVRGHGTVDVDAVVSALSDVSEVRRVDLAMVHSPDLSGDEGSDSEAQYAARARRAAERWAFRGRRRAVADRSD